ncbi:MAG: hypothetical protein ACKVT1_17200 [Dehalococcoidia bacterium]
MAQALCKVGGRFSKCVQAPVNTCQYCGRPFCGAHTYHIRDHEAVCNRKGCRLKQDDLVQHMAYRRRVRERNHAGLCGVEDCGPHPRHECSLCQGNFCPAHVSERMYPFREGYVSVTRPASVCNWCWRRRKIWRR